MLKKLTIIVLLGAAPSFASAETDDSAARESQLKLAAQCSEEAELDKSSLECFGFITAMGYCANFRECIPNGYVLVKQDLALWEGGLASSTGGSYEGMPIVQMMMTTRSGGQVLEIAPAFRTYEQFLMSPNPPWTPLLQGLEYPNAGQFNGFGAEMQNPPEFDAQGGFQGGD